jgi:ATP/maltotriose-dependent transcriptional regulator MalT/DNA-binding SARP family transcriptional activator
MEEFPHVVWYQLSEEDQDPFVFLRYLCSATQRVYPDLAGLPIPLLESGGRTRDSLAPRDVAFQYLNAIGSGVDSPTLIIIDDLHLIDHNHEVSHLLDSLIALAPAHLHFVISSRQNIQLPNLYRWRSLGQVQTLDQSLLIFSEEEISSLYRSRYGIELSAEEVEDLYINTEGWAISLQLIGQGLKNGAIKSVKDALSKPASPMDSLFEILAKDVLEGQSDDIRMFMRHSSVFQTMVPEACNFVLEIVAGAEKLGFIQNNDLFVTELGGGELRYHPIFQQFLYQQLDEGRRQELHKRAADYFKQINRPTKAIYHFVRVEDYLSAAELLNSYGQELHALGHLDTLANYLDRLSPEALSQFPTLIFYMGDLARFHSRFEEALGWYQQAEALWRERNQMEGVGRALRGQARIYLDTVNPSKAEELLQEALRLSDGIQDRETRARLFHLLAENKLNLGKVDEAEGLRERADVLRQEGPDDSQLWYRVLLRTGRISEARQQLEMKAEEESSAPYNLPRSHRETQLLLSIIYAMQGDQEAAMQASTEAIRRGEEMESPFITAVGYIRQGHAYTMLPNKIGYSQARELFERVIEISEELSTPRLPVEALWGLVRAHGYQGDLEKAFSLANSGTELAMRVGDEWVASLIRLAMGASFVLAGNFEQAAEWLDGTLLGFQECSDPFGCSSVNLWRCYAWFKQEEFDLLHSKLSDLLSVSQKNDYDYLFTRITLLGIPEERLIVPMLVWARENTSTKGYVENLLSKMGLARIRFHPGYQLRVQALGGFQVWRGSELIAHRDWRREKTRQLFQLLLTYRNQPLDRDQIYEHLWPGTDPSTAQPKFKAALNTLYGVLEPERKPKDPSAYVLREGSVYGVRPGCDIWLDVDQFTSLLEEAEKLVGNDTNQALDLYGKALEIYQGEYLPDARYMTWPIVEREHFAVLYLQTADKFCELNLSKRQYHQVIEECRRILSYDGCWERAYRHLMKAYDGLGDHGQVARVYRRCVDNLRTELNVKPSVETDLLFHKLTRSG